MKLESELFKYFGYSDFRDSQKEVILNVMSRRDTFNILPTSFGKSICFQLPALLIDGLTIVITPLISLMVDQVLELRKNKFINAAYLNSKMSTNEINTVYENLYNTKLLYISPERMYNFKFLSTLKNIKVSYIIVDEAHTVIKWGSDFRKSFLDIGRFRLSFNYYIPISLFTATISNKELNLITKVLGLKKPIITNYTYTRSNLLLSIIKTNCKNYMLEKFLNISGTKIIYASSIKTVMNLYELFKDKFSITYYHGKLDQEIRNKNQNDFILGNKEVIVSTNAFGMGINKKDVRYVIHYEMSGNISDYMQESGRCARDGGVGRCIVLYKDGDLNIHQYLAKKSYNENKNKSLYLEKLKDLRFIRSYLDTKVCLNSFAYKKLDASLSKCGCCDNCLTNKYKIKDLDPNINLHGINQVLLNEAKLFNNKEVSFYLDIDLLNKLKQLNLGLLVRELKDIVIFRYKSVNYYTKILSKNNINKVSIIIDTLFKKLD